MKKVTLIVVFLLAVAVSSPAVWAMEITDTLSKDFKSTHYPFEEQTVRILIRSEIEYLRGNKKEYDELRTIRMQQKVVSVFKQNGWRKDDPLLVETIGGGLVEIVIGEGTDLKLRKTNRLSLFLNMCDHPKRKYRGGDLNEFLNRIIEEAEDCLTYEYRLQGKNYPY